MEMVRFRWASTWQRCFQTWTFSCESSLAGILSKIINLCWEPEVFAIDKIVWLTYFLHDCTEIVFANVTMSMHVVYAWMSACISLRIHNIIYILSLSFIILFLWKINFNISRYKRSIMMKYENIKILDCWDIEILVLRYWNFDMCVILFPIWEAAINHWVDFEVLGAASWS